MLPMLELPTLLLLLLLTARSCTVPPSCVSLPLLFGMASGAVAATGWTAMLVSVLVRSCMPAVPAATEARTSAPANKTQTPSQVEVGT